MKILILCTGNSCRSQMAEGFLRSFDTKLSVFSAGTNPEKEINPFAVEVMKEIGIDISSQYPKDVSVFLDQEFDYVITVCDNAKETCPNFTGNVKNRLHIGFEDPAKARGPKEEVLPVYRRIRDQIRESFWKLYTEKLRS
ncbi:MAG: arsenate reductase ArsC [Ignavibacteria bacterium]|nr:arsenate reductase ArsC [Ignavibacteria bacterium]